MIVRESINFERGQSPIKSMGIGLAARRVFKDVEDAAQWAYLFPSVCTEGDVKSSDEWKNFFNVKQLNPSRLESSELRIRIVKWFKRNTSLEVDEWYMSLKDAKDILLRLEEIIQEKYYDKIR